MLSRTLFGVINAELDYPRYKRGQVMGVYKANKSLAVVEDEVITEVEYQTRVKFRYNGKKQYELSNHLGNVLVTISDRRKAICNEADSTLRYEAVVITASDYYSFGSPMIGRTYQAGNPLKYRYSFNGKEKDDEICGDGNELDFGARIYDGRLGKFLNMDPLCFEFPSHSPYTFCFDNPICLIDIEGESPTPPRVLDRSKPHIKYEYYTKIEDGQTNYYKKAHYYNVNFTPTVNQTQEKKITEESYRLGKKWTYINAGPKAAPFALDLKKDGRKSKGSFEKEYSTMGATKLSIILKYNTDEVADEIKIEYYDKETSTWITATTTGMTATGTGAGKDKTLEADISIPEGATIRVTVTNDKGKESSIWNFDLKISTTEVGASTTYSDDWHDKWENDDETERLTVEHDPVQESKQKLNRVENHNTKDED